MKSRLVSEQARVLHLHESAPPLSRLATEFDETWEFKRIGDTTNVNRCFDLHATSGVARPALWLISILLRQAISRHLRELQGGTSL